MKSTVTFKEYFKFFVEDMTAGGAMGVSTVGATGFNPAINAISSGPRVYGDNEKDGARIPTGPKVIQKRSGAIKLSKKKKLKLKK